MNYDSVWQSLRYVLIGVGGYLAGRGTIPTEQVVPLTDTIITVISGLVAMGSAMWGMYVKWNTTPVLDTVVKSKDLPTTSGATGANVGKPSTK